MLNALLLAGALCAEPAAEPATVSVHSGPTRTPLVELFTSEGCSSCPPADKLLARIGGGEGGTTRPVTLAYHVTCWDYIGWRDRFASPRFDARQKLYARRSAAAGIYTPQFVLDGIDPKGNLDRALGSHGEETARVTLSLTATWDAPRRTLRLEASAERGLGRGPSEPLLVHLAVFERNLQTAVRSGENRGRTLQHDFVVRELSDPVRWPAEGERAGSNLRWSIPAAWKEDHLGVAAFVQGEESLAVYQAVSVSLRAPNSPGK